MAIASFEELYAAADGAAACVPVAVAGGDDPTVLVALHAAAARRWVQPILAGSASATTALARQLDLSLDAFTLIDTDAPAVAAVDAVRSGRASLLMKGQIATPDLMKGVLDAERGLRTGRPIAQVVLMEIVRDGRRFLLTDTGINLVLNAAKKRSLVAELTSIGLALRTGTTSDPIRIAAMAASEKVNPAMPETLEAAELATASLAGEFPAAVVEGPLSFDLAYAADAGEKKRIGGSVVGAAEAMLFHDLLSANLTVKAMMYTADCRFGGLLVGTTAPVVFMSRADTAATRLNSLALSLAILRARGRS